MTDHPDTNPTNASRRQTWTEANIRALGATTSLLTAASILNIGRTVAYQLVADDQFPVPVIRVRGRYVVPVQPLLNLLHLDDPIGIGSANRLDTGATSSVDTSTPPADFPRPRSDGHPEHPEGDR